MANFFLIDQSLRDAGGHHWDYAQCIAQAANEMGFFTTIGTHRKFSKTTSIDADDLKCFGSLRPVFHQTIYQGDSYLAGLQRMKRRHVPSQGPSRFKLYKMLRHRFLHYRHWRRREKIIRQFAIDCGHLFRNSLFTPDDHVFFATVSELELMGLASFLSHYPRAMQAQWHLQFHFNLFNGRPPEYESQSATVKSVRSCFLAALARLSYHSINFYTTSEELTQQYSELGVGEFETLPYPVGREFVLGSESLKAGTTESTILKLINQSADTSQRSVEKVDSIADAHGPPNWQSDSRQKLTSWDNCKFATEQDPARDNFRSLPIRVTCPGGIRREKGHAEYLQPLVNEIYENLLATGTTQLILQRPPQKWLQPKKIELTLPLDSQCELEHAPILYAGHPLPRGQYIDLIRSTDVGLLFYDSDVYYSRRAGVLGELLSAGKPVIVPAGCWLAEQIQEPVFKHADQLLASADSCCRDLSELRWESRNVPMPGGVLSFDAGRRPFHFECNVESHETLVGFRFDWHWPQARGVYCRVELVQIDDSGNTIDTACQTVGHRDFKKTIAAFKLAPTATKLKFSLRNAFHHSTASIKNVAVISASVLPDANQPKFPIGAVGIVAADRQQIGRAMQEIVEHIDHYRATAEAFSQQWAASHDPKRTVAHLIASEYGQSKAA